MGSQRLVFSSVRRIKEYKDDFNDKHYHISMYDKSDNNKKEVFPNIQSENKATSDKPAYINLNDMQGYYSTLLK